MRFVRYTDKDGTVYPGVLGAEGSVHHISGLVDDIGPDTLGAELIAAVQAADLSQLPLIDTDTLRQTAPFSVPSNIWCIGLNYSDHAAEAGMDVPEEPILFNKSSVTFCGPFDPIPHSSKMTKLDWEVELGIVIGKRTLNISKEDAMDHVFGFTVVNDVSERAWQLERGGQWVKGKSYPNFCPVGPELVTADAVDDVQALDLWLDVNGRRMQTGTTAKMIFDVETIVSYMSEFCQLEPGDLICTGTPPGVGAGMSPQIWLRPGDIVRLGISGLGEQTQRVEAVA